MPEHVSILNRRTDTVASCRPGHPGHKVLQDHPTEIATMASGVGAPKCCLVLVTFGKATPPIIERLADL